MERPAKILVVDSEKMTLNFFEVMFRNLGYEIIVADNGNLASDILSSKIDLDLIILEPLLSGVTGLELIKKIKEDPIFSIYQSVPIIMISSVEDIKSKVEVLELGVDDYIVKPFNFSEVLARIRSVLRHREYEKELRLKEAGIASLKMLNDSLIYFTKHLRKPLEDLIDASYNLDSSSIESVEEFKSGVRDEAVKIEAVLKALESEIEDIENNLEDFDKSEFLKDLESKFFKNFINLKSHVN